MIAIPNDQERLLIEEKAKRSGWTSAELEAQVKIRKIREVHSYMN